MTRGTFANVRVKNLLTKGRLYGQSRRRAGWDQGHVQGRRGKIDFIHTAAMNYKKDGTPLGGAGGEGLRMGSSRDWAAKGRCCWACGR